MKNTIQRATSYWILSALWLGTMAWGFRILAHSNGSKAAWAACAALAATTLGLLMRKPWARQVGLLLLVGLMLFKIYGLATSGVTVQRIVYLAALGITAYGLWKKPNTGFFGDEPAKKADDDEKAPKPIISLVHLRSQARYLETPVLAHALSEAWGLKVVPTQGEDTEDADGFVGGESPYFIVTIVKPTLMAFTVLNHDTPYFDEPDEVAARTSNLRFAQVIREHTSWLAVDLVHTQEDASIHEEAYKFIGKAVSALADDSVVALYCPQHGYFNLWSPELETLLCGDRPLDALSAEVKAPVIGVPDGEAIEKAIEEARRRWPEFVSAYQNRAPGDDRFLVKARFVGEDAEAEHMWMTVFGLEPEYVHGHLMNEPIHTTKLKKGALVEVPVADVSDWICADVQGEPLGNFTHRAVAAAARHKSEADVS